MSVWQKGDNPQKKEEEKRYDLNVCVSINIDSFYNVVDLDCILLEIRPASAQ